MKNLWRSLLMACSVLAAGLAGPATAQAATEEVKICYRAHLANYGWQKWKCNGEFAGTAGENRAVEAAEVQIWGKGTFSASAHVRNEGSQIPQFAASGEVIRVGTVGKALPMESLTVSLGQFNGTLEGYAHIQNLGWVGPYQGYAVEVGTRGQVLQLEGFSLKILN
ncbi:hypothetical protein [Streptomyces sp. NPDC023838]|uniref:hypothetical protein n=1 Tax=Streptomyces sp. NPDC023838 TaxID=3154325 RepID=UPI0033C0FD43